MKREAAVRVMWPQAKEHWPGAPRAGRVEEYILLLSLQREQSVCQHPDFGLLAPETSRQ